MHEIQSVEPKCVEGRLSLAGLHVDGVGVLLAQRLVLLGVERLALKVHVANLQAHSG